MIQDDIIERNMEMTLQGIDKGKGPGGLLRTAREKATLTKKNVAEHLHLRTEVIEAMERDEYHQIKANFVFVRGYLRAYSKLVNLDGDQVVHAFNSMGLSESTSDRPKWQPPKQKDTSVLKRLEPSHYYYIGGGILFILLAMVFWRQSGHDEPANLLDNTMAHPMVEKAPTDDEASTMLANVGDKTQMPMKKSKKRNNRA